MGSAAALVALLAGTTLVSGCENFETTPGESIYCICDSKYCDAVPSVSKPSDTSQYTVISSSKAGLRFSVAKNNFGNNDQERVSLRLTIDKSIFYQNITGFGGTLTDSVGFVIKSLSDDVQEKLLQSYFGYDSIEYNMIRVPMGVSDFSPRPYSYAMTEDDYALGNFSLVSEDMLYKIPILKRMNLLTLKDLKLITAPWTPSTWMKTVDTWTEQNFLRREYWATWANYFVKFFQAYEKNNIKFWGLTPQNEPRIAFSSIRIPTVGWEANDQRKWITKFLSPALRNSQLDYLKIIIGDGPISLLPTFVKEILSTKEARDVVSGIGVKWYLDRSTSVNILDGAHKTFPNKFLLYTGTSAVPQERISVKLGSWNRAEYYANNIIDTLSRWVTGWIDWNMALDLQGGPNWLNRSMDAPIIVNADKNVFYKQPTYYVMGHFSRFIPPGSWRIGIDRNGQSNIKSVAFLTPDQGTVLILFNPDNNRRDILLEDVSKGSAKLSLPAKSIHSVIYW